MIDARRVPFVIEAVLDAAKRTATLVLAQAVLVDHVHVIVAFRPEVPLSSFVRHAKSESARRMNLEGRREFRWCRGYFAASVSHGQLEAARAYVGRQHRRHPDKIPA